MQDADMERHLRANPKLRKHEAAIREALDAIKDLHKSGIVEEGYRLAPAFGGKTVPVSGRSRKRPLAQKMTYCA